MHINFLNGLRVLKIFIFLFYSIQISLNAQIVYEPPNSSVYEFIERLSLKGLVDFSPVIKPVSRIDLYSKLIEAQEKSELLSEPELDELIFYLKDFSLERSFLSEQEPVVSKYFFSDGGGRFRLFSYNDNLFKLNLDPVQGYKMNFTGEKKSSVYSTGISLYGYFSDYIGFSFYFRDNTESGETISNINPFSNRTGIILNNRDSGSIGYSDIRSTLTANWSWGSISAGKDIITWGEGKSGNLVLSQKAPSFPFIKLDLYPIDWLRFNYFHGWLNSSIIDSSLSYPTLKSNGKVTRDFYKSKFIASHTLSVNIIKGLDISFGESIIYEDEIKPLYLFPLMFFRAADHYESNFNNNAGDNSQFFFHASAKNLLSNTHFFGSVFIDELSISNFFDKNKRKNQSGFTLGAAETDLLIENLSLHFEYTRINPFAYQHFIPTLTYENHSHLLGHWIGNNADILYMSGNYRIARGVVITGWLEYIRKGEAGTADEQFAFPQKEFLSGRKDKNFNTGVEIAYQVIHSLFLKGEWKLSDFNVDSESSNVRQTGFIISMGYNL